MSFCEDSQAEMAGWGFIQSTGRRREIKMSRNPELAAAMNCCALSTTAHGKTGPFGATVSVTQAKAGIRSFEVHCVFWPPVFTAATTSARIDNMSSDMSA
jgi:hypothetical protein